MWESLELKALAKLGSGCLGDSKRMKEERRCLFCRLRAVVVGAWLAARQGCQGDDDDETEYLRCMIG